MGQFRKLQRMAELDNPPLYNPAAKGNCSHSFTGGYVSVLLEK